MKNPKVKAVCRSGEYSFSKPTCSSIKLVKGIGVEGDIHSGKTVKHRSRIRKDPTVPNLRQVHLMHAELHDELRTKGFDVNAGDLGENITTEHIDILELPRDTILHIGEQAKIQVTGLRNPCAQIDNFQKGLLKAVIDKGPNGELIRKSGIMSVVLEGGVIKPGDNIRIEYPPEPHKALEKV